MSGDSQPRRFEAFFLPASGGERFCLFHPASGSCRGAILYLHPFAEEMNKSRRMAALQSRALAGAGYSVLQIDLAGCGDSSGDFADANWEMWRDDVVLGMRWLRHNAHADVVIWGLRLGALLAVDAANACDLSPAGFVLWQPVLTGEAMLTQFLRLRLASEMLAESKARTGVKELRGRLASGASLEIAGYELTGRMATAIDGCKLVDRPPVGNTVRWFEIVPETGRELPHAARRTAEAWTEGGVHLETRCVAGPQFWNSPEIAECPDLITATTRALVEDCAR